jgi:8-oxo-dGTP diphosphatase
MSSLTSAVAALIEDADGRVLLCQQSQGHRLWGLPGGSVRHGESPTRAVIRDIRHETGLETEPVDLVGLYHLTGNTCGEDMPDVLVYVFRARLTGGEASVNAPGRIRRLSWHAPGHLPQPVTATTRTAIADAADGRSGALRTVHRDAEPEVPEAGESAEAPRAAVA